MKEEFLHFIWKNRLFNQNDLETIDGIGVEVIDPGSYNTDAGPDFFNARIRIGSTEWAGNIEIHINASSWNSHGHNKDHVYDNVILHVVKESDSEVFTSEGRRLETVLLKWEDHVYGNYEEFLHNPNILACKNYLKNIDSYLIRHAIHNAAVERIRRKCNDIRPLLSDTLNNWEETLYRMIARYFGMNINSEPFLRLATALPLKILRKHLDNRTQVEALFFGMAGLLETALFPEALDDDYFRILAREFRVLKAKYRLVPLDGWLWKFHRMRPANFPTIRISQLAGLLVSSDPIFEKLKNSEGTGSLKKLVRAETSEYWRSHYIFGKATKSRTGATGDIITGMLIINTVVPLLFLYGIIHNQYRYCDKAVDLADSLEPEENRILRRWHDAGILPASAFESQGLIEIYTMFCKNRKCLNCHIGSKLISLGKEIKPENNPHLGEPVN